MKHEKFGKSRINRCVRVWRRVVGMHKNIYTARFCFIRTHAYLQILPKVMFLFFAIEHSFYWISVWLWQYVQCALYILHLLSKPSRRVKVLHTLYFPTSHCSYLSRYLGICDSIRTPRWIVTTIFKHFSVVFCYFFGKQTIDQTHSI